MHIKRYTIASFLLIALTGWYISTFISTQTISINLFGIEIAPLSVSIWTMIPLFVLYLASVIHMSFYSMVRSLEIRKYEKDYVDMNECISDAYLGKENRYHSFRTPRYKLLGSLFDNTRLFPTSMIDTNIDSEKIATTLKLIEDIKAGKVVDLKKMALSQDNELVIQNERNKYKSGTKGAEDFLSNPTKYNNKLLHEIYADIVKFASLKTVEKYKTFMDRDTLLVFFSRSDLEISNEALIKLFDTLELNSNDYIRISQSVSSGITPEQRMKLFETLSDSNDDAMEAYLYTLYDLEMIEPADAILEISQADEYLNFKAYRALKECNKNFNINLFVIDRIC